MVYHRLLIIATFIFQIFYTYNKIVTKAGYPVPHITVEYSANLRPHIDSKMLLQCVHRSAMESGLFRPGAIRSRGVQRDEYIVADGHKDNAFVHILLRIGSGRDTETRKQLGNRIFSSASAFLDPLFEVIGLGLSVEIQVIDPETAFRRNSLHERFKQASDGNPNEKKSKQKPDAKPGANPSQIRSERGEKP